MAVSFNKSGIINANYFSEHLISLYDPELYVEPDQSAWIRIVHHANADTKKFASTNTFSSHVYLDGDRWFNASVCNLLSENWELMVKQRETVDGTERKWRWVQPNNPMTATFNDVVAANITQNTSTGYSTTTWGGLYYKNSSTYLCANNGASGNWWGAIGAWATHNGGIPAWGGYVVTTGFIDLYLRVDQIKLDHASIFENAITAPEFIEY